MYCSPIRLTFDKYALGLIFILLFRYFQLQILNFDQYSKKANTNRIRKVTLSAPRGLILDRNGKILVDNIPTYILNAIPGELSKRDEKFQFISDSVNPQQAYNIYKKGYRYQKTGIIFSGLKDVDIYNKNLFSKINNDEKRIKLMKAIDYTNIKYGRFSLSIAQAGLKSKWNIKKQHSSKIDTACFELLPAVRI